MGDVVGMYLRLSDDDYDIDGESISISSQRSIIRFFLEEHEELKNSQVIEFIDDGFSGRNFNRPAVQRLLHSVQTGEIKTIIVKDLSRFGRNYIDVGNYIEQVFPFLGVRLISIDDQYDSSNVESEDKAMEIEFKTIIHDMYSRDLSQKTITAKRARAKSGKHVTAYAPYGYRKTTSGDLKIDEETAGIVSMIFQLAYDGMANIDIVRKLNAAKIDSPSMIRKKRREKIGPMLEGKNDKWSPTAISSILKDQRYVGDAIYGRYGTSKDMKTIKLPKDQWIVVENAYEPIVDREIFEALNKNKKKKKWKKRKETVLQGKIKCAVCGCTMISLKKGENKAGAVKYKCRMPWRDTSAGCYKETIYENDVGQTIIDILNKYSKMADSGQKGEKQDFQIPEVRKEISELSEELKRYALKKRTLYEKYREEEISREEYTAVREQLAEEEKKTTEKISKKEMQLAKIEIDKAINNPGNCLSALPIKKLTREIADLFVDTIYVLPDGNLKIIWKFKDISAIETN